MKKKPLKPNIKLLRRIQRAILKKTNQFQMMYLFSNTLDNDKEAGGCGTAGCIAGRALHLTSKNKRLDETRTSMAGVDSRIKKAGKLIGVPTREGIASWDTFNWYGEPDTVHPTAALFLAQDRRGIVTPTN